MKKTTSSLLFTTAALGLIVASADVAFISETPVPDQSASPAPVPSVAPSADPVPSNGADDNGALQPDLQPSNMPQPPDTPDSGPNQNPQPGQPEPSTPAADQAPAADQGGAGTALGPIGTTDVTARGQIPTGNSPAPVSARGGVRNANAPVDAPIASNPTLANTDSVASIATGIGVITLAGGMTFVAARKRH